MAASFMQPKSSMNNIISECCGAGTYGDYMICEDCKEHCTGEEVKQEDDEMCGFQEWFVRASLK